jgi:hypothetical protein
MKAAFSAEALGLGPIPPWPARLPPGYAADRRLPWVAEITGTDPRYGLARTFLPRKLDCRHANRKGTRGVECWWTLESGRLYQARYRVTWDEWVTRWLTVTPDGEIEDVTEQEVAAWASGISAPTS